ncbi:MAG: hypothetical protein WDN69_35370 [Aliidongia sp.]
MAFGWRVPASLWPCLPGSFWRRPWRAATAGFGVEFDGTCEVGSCPPSALPTGESSFVPYALRRHPRQYGDSFRIEGTLSAVYSAGGTSQTSTQAFAVTYLGNPSGQASQADTLTIDNLLNFDTPASPVQVSSGAAGAFYSVTAASSVAVKDSFNTNDALFGPFPAPESLQQHGEPRQPAKSRCAALDRQHLHHRLRGRLSGGLHDPGRHDPPPRRLRSPPRSCRAAAPSS